VNPVELFRFRIVRPVQSQPSDGLVVPPLGSSLLQSSASGIPSTVPDWLLAFASALALRSDLVTPADCVTLLPSGWQTQVEAQPWIDLRDQLNHDIAAGVSNNRPPQLVEELCRLLLVHDLLSTLDAQASLPVGQRTLQTALDVQGALARHVIVPAEYFVQNTNAVLARQPGFTDLYVVRDEWHHYEAGELAAVTNVLPGETLESRIRHSQETDTLTSTTTVTTTSQQTEQDQTTSTSLSDASTKDTSLSIGVQGQVQTSGTYGLTHVDTSLGAQLQVSQTTADSHASTTAYQTVQRAVKSVTQTVTTVQSERTVTKDSTYGDHKLSNTGDTVTVGLYKWLSTVHRVELVRYPNRFVLEFEVPEPGAWLRWALANPSSTGWDNPDPGPFHLPGATKDLSPDDILADDWTASPNPANWRQLAEHWKVRGLTPAPPQTVTIATQISVSPPSPQDKPPNQQTETVPRVAMAVDESLTVPTGYTAEKWTANVAGFRGEWGGKGTDYVEAWITVGGAPTTNNVSGGSQGTVWVEPGPAPRLIGAAHDWSGADHLDVGEVKTGTIPVALYAYEFVEGLTCNVNVICQRAPETLAQWQAATFDQVVSAYQTLLAAYHTERDARNEQVSGQADLAGPPELNQSRAINELRRLVIQELLGQAFDGTAITVDAGTQEPSVDLAKATAVAPTIQFFEQAFEWSNLVYICYPYYWGRRTEFPVGTVTGTGTNIWVTDVTSASADPEFDQFLNAGSARVVVPARPGFEDLVMYYLYTGQVWGGGRPPAPDDPDYLSIAQEIQSLQQGAIDGTPVGSSWEISLPTTLLWAGTDEKTLPTNSQATIPKPPPTPSGMVPA
jgi:hypothetical protein